MVKWFTLVNEIVQGPFTTAEVKGIAANRTHNNAPLVWGRVQKTWVDIDQWAATVDEALAASNIISLNISKEWHYGTGGDSFGPFGRADLIAQLKNLASLENVLLWTNGMNDWMPIFEFHDILGELGINRRKQFRAEASGSVAVSRGTNDITNGQIISISEGGLGFKGNSNYNKGETVQLIIDSPIFKHKVKVDAEVKYCTEGGYVGVSFKKIHPETQSQIVGYIKRAEAMQAPLYSQKSA
ncbi:MAG: GYF domain-containing protein [Bdellovibrionales bacterium]